MAQEAKSKNDLIFTIFLYFMLIGPSICGDGVAATASEHLIDQIVNLLIVISVQK